MKKLLNQSIFVQCCKSLHIDKEYQCDLEECHFSSNNQNVTNIPNSSDESDDWRDPSISLDFEVNYALNSIENSVSGKNILSPTSGEDSLESINNMDIFNSLISSTNLRNCHMNVCNAKMEKLYYIPLKNNLKSFYTSNINAKLSFECQEYFKSRYFENLINFEISEDTCCTKIFSIDAKIYYKIMSTFFPKNNTEFLMSLNIKTVSVTLPCKFMQFLDSIECLQQNFVAKKCQGLSNCKYLNNPTTKRVDSFHCYSIKYVKHYENYVIKKCMKIKKNVILKKPQELHSKIIDLKLKTLPTTNYYNGYQSYLARWKLRKDKNSNLAGDLSSTIEGFNYQLGSFYKVQDKPDKINSPTKTIKEMVNLCYKRILCDVEKDVLCRITNISIKHLYKLFEAFECMIYNKNIKDNDKVYMTNSYVEDKYNCRETNYHNVDLTYSDNTAKDVRSEQAFVTDQHT